MHVSSNDTIISELYQDIISCDLSLDDVSGYHELTVTARNRSQELSCPLCGGNVYVHDTHRVSFRDMPLIFGVKVFFRIFLHRYQCTQCSHTFSEHTDINYPGTRITKRAAAWVTGLLDFDLSISSVSRISGIHWDTISKLHSEKMKQQLDTRQKHLSQQGYKPTLLAVDEFAIHKGHTYATCVMDLSTGDVIWVGKGRGRADFLKFFEEVDQELLSDVKAVAMDMNASYNNLIKEKLPGAKIVYDRYHMQAQYGRDVLGSVRLEEAREHRERANAILSGITAQTTEEEKKSLRQKASEEKQLYTRLKSSRWTLLQNGDSLSDEKTASLKTILEGHSKVAVCYAMKEEMCELFEITDPDECKRRWEQWFEAAKASGIEQLVKFAELKEKRLEGLVSHAEYPISTGKLEGFNNKIKVAKRIGYGYRNDDYFFLLIRYISIPGVRSQSHRFP